MWRNLAGLRHALLNWLPTLPRPGSGGRVSGEANEGLSRRQLLSRGGIAGTSAVAAAGGPRGARDRRGGRLRRCERVRRRATSADLRARPGLREPNDLRARLAPAPGPGGDRAAAQGARCERGAPPSGVRGVARGRCAPRSGALSRRGARPGRPDGLDDDGDRARLRTPAPRPGRRGHHLGTRLLCHTRVASTPRGAGRRHGATHPALRRAGVGVRRRDRDGRGPRWGPRTRCSPSRGSTRPPASSCRSRS